MLKKTKDKAFTIVELLVVIAIIAIITAIITSNFATAKSKSRDAKRVSDLNNIQLALEYYFDRCKTYPKPSAGNIPDLNSSTGSCIALNLKLSNFISVIPSPPSNDAYTYAVDDTNNPQDYVLMTVLENDNSVLRDDIDGTVYSVDCEDTLKHYCITPR